MKNLIDSLGITHRRFAEQFNIPYNTVAQWYKGERNAPEWVKSLIEQISNDRIFFVKTFAKSSKAKPQRVDFIRGYDNINKESQGFQRVVLPGR